MGKLVQSPGKFRAVAAICSTLQHASNCTCSYPLSTDPELTNSRQYAQLCWAKLITFTIQIVCGGFVNMRHGHMRKLLSPICSRSLLWIWPSKLNARSTWPSRARAADKKTSNAGQQRETPPILHATMQLLQQYNQEEGLGHEEQHTAPIQIVVHWVCVYTFQNISLGRAVSCQHGAFSGVGAFVVSFVPAECPVGGGMWGIFGKPLKRAIRNTPGLHAVLTTCLRFFSALDSACVACCLFLLTGSHHVFIQIHTTCCCFP